MQIGVGGVAAAVCFFVWSAAAALSALAGAAIGVIANLYMTLKALQPAATPRGALGHLYFGQLAKIAVTVALFVLVARAPRLVWPALLAAYAATLIVFWWVPFAASSRT
jgi:ATP synthase protein I